MADSAGSPPPGWFWSTTGKRKLGRRPFHQRGLTLESLEERRLPSFIAPTLLRTGLAPDALVVADLTGTGIPDVVTANYDAGTVSVLLGN